MTEKEFDLRGSLEALFEDKRTPEQRAHSEGYTKGYRAAEDRYQRRAEYFDSLTATGDPEFITMLRSGKTAPLSKDEACRVWEEIHMYMEGHPEGRVLLLLHDDLTRELAKGARCGICGSYDDPSCAVDC